MGKYKKYNLYAAGVITTVICSTYLIFKLQCFNSCNTQIIKPFFAGSLGLLLSVLYVLCFAEKVFVYWLMHIAWWVLCIATLTTIYITPGGFMFFVDRVQMALFWMVVLFIITLFYAPITHHILKKKTARETSAEGKNNTTT